MKSINLQVAVVVTVTILGILTALFAGGMLTPRGFGVAGLLAMFVSGVIWYLRIKAEAQSIATEESSLKQSRRISARALYVRVAVILALLVFSAWETRGGPWLPRLIGASILLIFLVGTVRASLMIR
jgi:hypothetical protein